MSCNKKDTIASTSRWCPGLSEPWRSPCWWHRWMWSRPGSRLQERLYGNHYYLHSTCGLVEERPKYLLGTADVFYKIVRTEGTHHFGLDCLPPLALAVSYSTVIYFNTIKGIKLTVQTHRKTTDSSAPVWVSCVQGNSKVWQWPCWAP